jgi:general secretion pathway protein D
MDKLYIKVYIFLAIAVIIFAPALSTPCKAAEEATKKMEADINGGISFKFVNVDLPTVIKFISDITGYNFIFDEKIRGKITIIAPTKLTIDESFSLFTSVLSLKGYTTIPTGARTYKIIPSSLAKQAGIIPGEAKVPVNESYITRLIETKNIKAEDALQFLRPVVSRDGHISAFGPRNLLLVVDSAMNIEKITSILKAIDKPSVREEPAKINVYFLEHANAEDLAKVLQGIIKDIRSSMKIARQAAPNGKRAAPPVLSVTPDKATNSLIIVAPPSEYRDLVKVIKTLDRKRKQVYVEAMIIEASIDKLRELGTRWRAIARSEGEPIAIGGFGNVSSSTVLDIVSGLAGFSAGGMGNFLDIPVTSIGSDGTISVQTLTSPGFAALFSLNDFRDAVNVLSTPQILTSDNQEAEILVGENVPFISQRERDVTTTNTVLNSIQRTDVGIKLRITPQITDGNYVKLDIFQEISAVKDTPEEVLTTVGPTTTKRSTRTTVIVKDGHTVVIGGLMQEREEEGITKTPILGDIPVLGWLFKHKNVTKNKTNLLVFLSPHVVKESPELAEITKEKHATFVESEKFYNRGELLVRFRKDISQEDALRIIEDNKASVIHYYKELNAYHLQLRTGQDVEEAVSIFSNIPEVLYAEPNYKVRLQKIPGGVTKVGGNNGIFPSIKETAPVPADEEPGPAENEPESREKGIPFADTETGQSGPGQADYRPSPALIISAPDTEDTPSAPEQPVTGTVPEQNEPADAEQPSAPAISTGKGEFSIQIGAWKHIEYAIEKMEKIKSRFPGVSIKDDGSFHKLVISGIDTREEGLKIVRELKAGYDVNPILIKQRDDR